MNLYIEVLHQSYRKTGNNICLGLDPQWQKLPTPYRRCLALPNQAPLPDCTAIQDFLELSLQSLRGQGFCPAAFKPNLGYFQTLDRPLLLDQQQAFSGSRLLAWLHRYLSENFPNIPIILDFKKGDIARSSANYAEEGFALWGSDAVTVSPYMGSDSISPFGAELQPYLAGKAWPQHTASLSCKLPCGSGGAYSLLRTSNPGGRDLQDLRICAWSLVHEYGITDDATRECENLEDIVWGPLYLTLAETLLRWRSELHIPGLGAVVGATSLAELRQLAQVFSSQNFPLLIPGVGKQGGSFQDVQQSLQDVGYPLELARINLSSGLLQSWNGEAPKDWPKYISQKFAELISAV